MHGFCHGRSWNAAEAVARTKAFVSEVCRVCRMVISELDWSLCRISVEMGPLLKMKGWGDLEGVSPQPKLSVRRRVMWVNGGCQCGRDGVVTVELWA